MSFKKRRLLLIIDKAKLSTIGLLACANILIFGTAYWLLSRSGNGIHAPFGEPSSYLNCLHFSVVTFTSLGYGDFYPVGWGKLVADIEVTGGLLFLGIVIAKLASTRQNYYLAQLYASDAQKRLREFVSDLRRLQPRYQPTAGDPPLTTGVLKRLHLDAEVLVMRIRNYVAYEGTNGDFFGEIPKSPMARILHYCSVIAPLIAQTANMPDSLHSQRQRCIAVRVLGWMAELATLVGKNSTDPSLLSEARNAVTVTTKERLRVQTRFDQVASRFPKAQMARPIEWQLTKGPQRSD